MEMDDLIGLIRGRESLNVTLAVCTPAATAPGPRREVDLQQIISRRLQEWRDELWWNTLSANNRRGRGDLETKYITIIIQQDSQQMCKDWCGRDDHWIYSLQNVERRIFWSESLLFRGSSWNYTIELWKWWKPYRESGDRSISEYSMIVKSRMQLEERSKEFQSASARRRYIEGWSR